MKTLKKEKTVLLMNNEKEHKKNMNEEKVLANAS